MFFDVEGALAMLAGAVFVELLGAVLVFVTVAVFDALLHAMPATTKIPMDKSKVISEFLLLIDKSP